ncbi:MAG: L-serine ammonia-lyase, iron-sulfur-dependent, subunit alpha [Flexilinea sp.]|nr:L-serine ammonia-lyase, iron-sulfur-dependent, subunit alpha [Flexilinea sp.]
MDTIKHLFRIGYGPSSSHTMGPKRAAEIFYHKNPNANRYVVTLYGSLAATGKGHMTDKAINDVLGIERTTIIWQPDIMLPYHPNGMEFEAFDEAGGIIDDWTVYSVGGGRIDDKGDRIPPETISNIYPHRNMREIQKYLNETGMNFWEYVEECEGSEIWDYLREIWQVMSDAVDRGVRSEGVIPGGLGITRKANLYFRRSQLTRDGFIHSTPMTAFALAVAEENATGGRIVTAPTCGSCGVLPAVLRYFQKKMDITETNILRAIATAGVFGNVVKHNGSISGAEAGCQAEIGVACAMGAAAASYFYSGSIRQIEYAAESGLEHHLGLTCDPVAGLVQVPCIERNAAAANSALFSAQFVMFSDGAHRVSFDDVIEVMMHTGIDMPRLYRETSEGGLAKVYRIPTGA